MFGNGFYNPYFYQPYYQAARAAGGLGSAATGATSLGNGGLRGLLSGGRNLLGKFSFSGFLNGASKTLNVVNQAIPIFYQVRPMFHNAKTMFKILGAVKDDKPVNNSPNQNQKSNPTSEQNSSNHSTSTFYQTTENQNFQEENPTFFI